MRGAGGSRLGLRELPPVRLGALRMSAQLGWTELCAATERRLPVLNVLDQVARGADYRSLPVKSAMNSPAATHMGFWSINPYIGCEFGCTYCYARDTHRYTVERATREARVQGNADLAAALSRNEPAASFERHILVKDGLAGVLSRTLQPALVGHTAIVIGTATDPWQPAERRFGVTRSVLTALLGFSGLTIGMITKSPLIARDLPILQQLAERHRVKVHISLATDDRDLIRRLEARSPAPAARLRALEVLCRAGLDAGLLVAPIVPLITDSADQLRRLFTKAVAAGARRVHGQPLRLAPAARRVFLAQLRREFPDMVARYERHYGASATAAAAYRDGLRNRLRALREEFKMEPASWEEGRVEGRTEAAVVQAGQWDLLSTD